MNRLLIVEDDALMARVYVEKFRSLGFEVDIAMDGPAAIEHIVKSMPDIVLLDLMLGEVSGVDVLKVLRENEATRSLPVLVLSNAFMGDLVQSAWKAGANKCLSKSSCSPNKLVEEVRALLAPSPAPVPVAVAGAAARVVAPLATGDERVQENLRVEVVESLRHRTTEVRQHLHEWVKDGPRGHSNAAQLLYTSVRAIASGAALAGYVRLSQIASALEVLLKNVIDDPGKFSPSLLRTATQAVELIPALFRDTDTAEGDNITTPLVLVLDDDIISREAINAALELAQLHGLRIGDPDIAISLFSENSFALVILDIELPGTTGFEVCNKLHASEPNTTTPVVFVTSHSDFETRSHSTNHVGSDFIAKPFGMAELAVKALVQLHRAQLLSTV